MTIMGGPTKKKSLIKTGQKKKTQDISHFALKLPFYGLFGSTKANYSWKDRLFFVRLLSNFNHWSRMDKTTQNCVFVIACRRLILAKFQRS